MYVYTYIVYKYRNSLKDKKVYSNKHQIYFHIYILVTKKNQDNLLFTNKCKLNPLQLLIGLVANEYQSIMGRRPQIYIFIKNKKCVHHKICPSI
jgi:hypothetical protein